MRRDLWEASQILQGKFGVYLDCEGGVVYDPEQDIYSTGLRGAIGGLYIGELALRDLPAKELYRVARKRNEGLIYTIAELSLLIKEGKDNERLLADIAFRLEKSLCANMPTDCRHDYHGELAMWYELYKYSSTSFGFSRTSNIVGHLIPLMPFYKSYVEKIEWENVGYNSLTARDYDNWKDFIFSHKTLFSKFFSKSLSSYIDFNAFKEHGYVLGATKAGKTELLKVIAHHIIANIMKSNPKAGGMIIDPHGDLSKEVRAFKECYNNDRIIVFDPTVYNDKTPSIDPFYTPDMSDQTIEVIADHKVNALEEIIDNASLSANMKVILIPCVSVLLRRKNSSLADLQRFMIEEGSEDLLELGRNSPNPGQAEFFKNGFLLKKYEPTKNAIYTRLQVLQNFKIFSRILNPKGTLNIERELNDGKFIIFNLSKGAMSDTVSKAFGRLLVSDAKVAGFRRESIPISQRPESYIFIDECQNYISESMNEIFQELRKYGIHLILANQFYGQEMSTQLVKSIMTNTGVKISGKNGLSTNTAMSKELGIDIEELNKLTTGKFCVHVKQNKPTKPFILPSPTFCLGFSNAMGVEKWREEKARSWKGYVKNSILDKASQVEKTSNQKEYEPGIEYTTETPKADKKFTSKFDL